MTESYWWEVIYVVFLQNIYINKVFLGINIFKVKYETDEKIEVIPEALFPTMKFNIRH